jgi:hypothetical protein
MASFSATESPKTPCHCPSSYTEQSSKITTTITTKASPHNATHHQAIHQKHGAILENPVIKNP